MKLLKRFNRSEFLRNTAIVASGMVISQGITILTAPLLTRIYHPVDYDVLGIYIMITGIIGAIATLQYHNVIILAQDEKIARQALSMCLVIAMLLTVFTLLLTLVLFNFIPRWFGNSRIQFWLLLAPVSVFFMGWNTTFAAWANRTKKYKLLSYNRVTGALLVPVFSISLGLLLAGPTGLMIGLLVGQVIPALIMGFHFFRSGSVRIEISWSDFKKIAREYIGLPKYSLPTEFINNFITYLPVMLFAITYQVGGIIGNFNLSTRMLAIPVTLISSSVMEVFRQKASKEYHENGSCRKSFEQTSKLLLIGGIVPFIILMSAGPWIFATVFGDNWLMAGQFAQIMAPLYFFRFVVNPVSYVYFIAGKQREDLLTHIGLIILVLISFGIAYLFSFDFYYALIAYTAAFCIIYVLYFVRSYQFSIAR